jgi:hypothetical protein
MATRLRFVCTVLVATATLGALSCASSAKQPPARTAERCVEKGAKTGVAGVKTGATTGVEGVKAAGKAVGGFVEGGTDKAREQWQEGKAQTSHTAHEGADDVRRESKAPDCP